jgi:hypothetical protein
LDFEWFSPVREVRHPERLDCLLALRRKRGEVATLQTAKAEMYTPHREAVLLAKVRAKLAGTFRRR